MNLSIERHCVVTLSIILATFFSMACQHIHSPSSPRTQGNVYERIIELPGLNGETVPLVMVRIPPGEYLRGSPGDEPGRDPDEGPVHTVIISDEFYLGKYEVTQAQWEALMDDNPSTRIGPNLPVNRVSWEDAQEFLQRLNGVHNDGRYRLPTEAEWEHACRAGTSTVTWFGNDRDIETLKRYAWFRENSDMEIQPVGQKPPNPWGLYDLYGNVWEWCQDWFGPYNPSAKMNPTGPSDGEEKVIRGASWRARPEYIRSADRGKVRPDIRYHTGGFRVAWSENE